MTRSLQNVAALIVAITILQLAGGLIGVRLPVDVAAEGMSRAALGFVSACYSAGFMLGAALATALLAHVGPIRVYAACAATFSAATLLLHFADHVWVWCLLRLLAGVAVALLFASVESWMSWSIDSSQRGEVLGVYQVSTKLGLSLGPFLVATYAPLSAEPWILAGAIAAISLVPICFTSTQQPDPPKAEPLALGPLFATAPAAVISSFGSGFLNTGILTLAPVYAIEHWGPGAAAGFFAAAWVGSLLLQWPAGRLSDRIDRRIVIGMLASFSGAAALLITIFDTGLNQWQATTLFFCWGAGALSFYGVGVAHMADRADRGDLANSAAGLLFIWAAGAVAGPIAIGVADQVFGGRGLFGAGALGACLVAAAMFWRRTARKAPAPEQKEEFAPYPASSVAAAEIAYGQDEERN